MHDADNSKVRLALIAHVSGVFGSCSLRQCSMFVSLTLIRSPVSHDIEQERGGEKTNYCLSFNTDMLLYNFHVSVNEKDIMHNS